MNVPAYCESTRISAKHAELRTELRKAVQESNGEIVAALIISAAAALRERDASEAAYRHHYALAHGAGNSNAETV